MLSLLRQPSARMFIKMRRQNEIVLHLYVDVTSTTARETFTPFNIWIQRARGSTQNAKLESFAECYSAEWNVESQPGVNRCNFRNQHENWVLILFLFKSVYSEVFVFLSQGKLTKKKDKEKKEFFFVLIRSSIQLLICFLIFSNFNQWLSLARPRIESTALKAQLISMKQVWRSLKEVIVSQHRVGGAVWLMACEGMWPLEEERSRKVCESVPFFRLWLRLSQSRLILNWDGFGFRSQLKSDSFRVDWLEGKIFALQLYAKLLAKSCGNLICFHSSSRKQ